MLFFIRKFWVPTRQLVISAAMMTATPLLHAADNSVPADLIPTHAADKLEIFAGAAYTPLSLLGELRTRATWQPLLDIDYERGRFFINTVQGIGFEVVKFDTLTMRVATGYRSGRDEKDDPRYRGLGNIPGSAQISGRIDWHPYGEGLNVIAQVSQALDDRPSQLLTLGISTGLFLTDTIIGFSEISTTWSNDQYAQSIFGVTPQQSLNSSYPVYIPSSGWIHASYLIGAQWQMTTHWSLSGTVGLIQIRGEAAASPIFDRHKLPNIGVFMTYTYGTPK